MRALSADTATALRLPIDELQLPWTLDIRTGDSSSAARSRQRKHLPTALITTPESLTILLSYPESFQHFHHLKAIVVDEWHELMGTKRGTQTELALARLSRIAPAAVRMGLSATLANQQQALHYLVGNRRQAEAKLIRGAKARPIQIRSILPPKIESFPWAGHLGLSMVQPVVETIQQCQTSLVFTNTRNQAERWYQELLKKRPDWAGRLALHHGSLDRQTRSWVENAMREGKLLATVCTSSLDLGVDFPTVEQVIQIGSPKGVARLIQRAGKSEHRPGLSSRLGFVPTNVLELLELASARKILRNASRMEARVPIQNPLDCLAQHAVTLALANPYSFREFAEEVRDCASYRDLQDEQLKWIFQYLIHGGESLSAYPEFHKVEHRDGHFQVTNRQTARLHRMSIGTISSDMGIEVKYLTGKRVGVIEERYVSRLKPGERFQFAGRSLELVRIREGTAYVRRSRYQPTSVPVWAGGRMPLSSELSAGIRGLLAEASAGEFSGPEMKQLQTLLELQQNRSCLPTADQWLVETYRDRKKWQYVFFPFDGRMVHEGLAAVVAQRMSKSRPQTISLAVNDFGFLLETNEPRLLSADQLANLFDSTGAAEAIEASLNATEMAKRQFREIARIAGLIHPGYPGQPKRARHLQAASNMFFEVFETYDAQNRFLQQARDEVLERQLEWSRLLRTLQRLQNSTMVLRQPEKYTPLAFPLVVERLRDRVSSESLDERVRKLIERMAS